MNIFLCLVSMYTSTVQLDGTCSYGYTYFKLDNIVCNTVCTCLQGVHMCPGRDGGCTCADIRTCRLLMACHNMNSENM